MSKPNPFAVAVEALRDSLHNLNEWAGADPVWSDHEKRDNTRTALALFERLAAVEVEPHEWHHQDRCDWETVGGVIIKRDSSGWVQRIYESHHHDPTMAEAFCVKNLLAALECRRRNGEVG